ncbi:MAG: hypothetical protein ABI178_10135 [Rhodanobacter sp.]
MIQGTQDYYSIQWAERGPAEAARVTFNEQRWIGRLKQLLPVFLCARVAGEEAPYPSCISRLPRDSESAHASTEDNGVNSSISQTSAL